MFWNYLILALRHLRKNKAYTFINIFGLAIGIAACFLIVLFIHDEYKYDRFHKNGQAIYRTAVTWSFPNGTSKSTPVMAYRLKPALETAIPEIESIVRISPWWPVLINAGEIEFLEDEIAFVDKEFFEMFTFELLKGNPGTVLEAPFTAVISEEIARKYFGDADPIGQILQMDEGQGSEYDFRVTGVMKEMPLHSHFHFNILFSISSGPQVFNKRVLENWGEGFSYTYLQLPPTLSALQVERQLEEFKKSNLPEAVVPMIDFFLQPLPDIYLTSQLSGEMESNGNIFYVYVFAAIAFFVMLIAAINYMNLATARSTNRAREVGMRKVMGAGRGQLIQQFLGESVLLTLSALILAALLVTQLLPAFNTLAGKSITLSLAGDWPLLLTFLLATLTIGILAGSYPAFFLSGFRPISVLKTANKVRGSAAWLRKGLVVMQFSISIFLIIATLSIFGQLDFIRNKNLGIDPQQVVVMPYAGSAYPAFKNELLSNSKILSVSASNKRPTRRLSSNLSYKAEGLDPGQRTSIKIVTVDFDFFETLGIDIVQGRSFSEKFSTDASEGFVLNEKAVSEIGWASPIGKWFETSTIDEEGNWQKRAGKVIGVARDVHFESLHSTIQPVAFFIEPNWMGWMSVKISSSDMPATIAFMKQKWDAMLPEYDFQFSFLDEDIQALYQNEERFMTIFIYFSILAIVIACLGIFGLASFTAEQRTREIGVRKTLGATIPNIIAMLSGEFARLVLLANLFAWPLAFYYMNGWLEQFSYHQDLNISIFVGGGLLALAIAGLSVSYQALRAALINPVEALKHE